MKEEISSMDLVALVDELKVLEGSRIDKFYQRDNELVMYAYKPGDKKYRLFMTEGKAFFTDYKREMPQKPPSFCMYLRKTLGGRKITRVAQYDFDRILEIHTDEEVLVCELFRNGNFILMNKNQDIKNAMTSGDAAEGREIYSGDKYSYPESTPTPDERKIPFLKQFDEEDIVVVLAAKAGLGGAYAEEVCARANVEKNKSVEDMTATEEERVIRALHEVHDALTEERLYPRVYMDGDMPVAATPIPFDTYEDEYEERTFDTFSEALDTYFTEKEKAEYREKKLKKYREKKDQLEHRLETQERKLEGLRTSIEENKQKADLIYENYGLVESILETVNQAREQFDDTEITERLQSEKAQGIPEAAAIVDLNLGNDQVVVDLDGMNVSIDLTQDVEHNATEYYEKMDDSKNKIPGVEEALKRTRKELEELEADEVDVDQAFKNKKEKKQKKEWYEKFRWFFSSDGYLVIGGRDTTTNDMVVKKYMENNDRYVHAEFTGAPSVVIKEGEDAPESTFKEAGQFAVTFARSWGAGVTAEDAYWVTPDQVTQNPESGEFLPKGSFVIRGDRTYMKNLPVKAAVGAYERDNGMVAMGGPPSAVEEQCNHYVILSQGREKPSDVAKEVQSHLHEQTGEDFNLDRIIRALPPGNATIAEKH